MTSADDELERAKKVAEEKIKKKLADKIVKMADEEFFPSRLKNCIWTLRVGCIMANIVCFPILGWLYGQWSSNIMSINMFVIFLIPLIFLGFITAIVALMKIPTD
jgi:F0F1-type ATP synthase assembly protein I